MSAGPQDVLVDLDDAWSLTQLEKDLFPMLRAVPNMRVTVYGIPSMLGPVHELREAWPQVTWGVHGFYHTREECRVWLKEEAEAYLEQALKMGYHRVFKAPNWGLDWDEVGPALKEKEFLVHIHPTDTAPPGMRYYRGPHKHHHPHVNLHTHLASNPSTDNVGTVHWWKVDYLKQVGQFLDIEALGEIAK